MYFHDFSNITKFALRFKSSNETFFSEFFELQSQVRESIQRTWKNGLVLDWLSPTESQDYAPAGALCGTEMDQSGQRV